MILRKLIVVGVLTFGYLHWRGAARQLPLPGVVAAADPSFQMMMTGQSLPVGDTECTAMPYAAYHLRARILGIKRYHDQASGVAPYDFVLGWGRMSDSAVYGPLNIDPGLRNFCYQPKGSSIPGAEIEKHSAAYHLIPANDEVAAALKEASLHDVAVLDGQLVEVRSPANSSELAPFTRGGGNVAACHMLRVSKVTVEPRQTP